MEHKPCCMLNGINVTEMKRKNYDWTMIFAKDIVTSFSSNSTTNKVAASKHCKVMRKSVQDLLERHEILFNAMVKKLDVCEKTMFYTFVKVADEVFEDGEINWGRIVTVYAFAARLAMACRQTINNNNNTVFLQNVAIHTGKYIWQKLGKWILEHGGWDAFVDEFCNTNPLEETIWRGLLFTAIGLGAMATVLAVR